MKFQKLGKNFSVFYIYGANLPYSEEEGICRTCPNGLFLKSAPGKNKISPAQCTDVNPCSPYDLEILYNRLDEWREKDEHTAEIPPGTSYYK